jgi:ATP-dependent DNA helicase RecG
VVNLPGFSTDDPEFNERAPFTGPVQQQITKVLDFFKSNILQEKIIKQPDKAEAVRIWNYPLEALEEAIANAIYHRDYQVREPVEVRIYPDSICILNYGGPDRSIKSDAFKIGPVKPRRYRNRRLGDFLKELDLTEGKATGIPRIKKALKENGSREPFFDFDEDRTFFEVDFYTHPAFKEEQTKVVPINNESLYLGERAIQILDIIKSNPSVTASEIAEKIGISKRATEKHLSKLKSAGILDRIGSDKSGQWIIKSSV